MDEIGSVIATFIVGTLLDGVIGALGRNSLLKNGLLAVAGMTVVTALLWTLGTVSASKIVYLPGLVAAGFLFYWGAAALLRSGSAGKAERPPGRKSET